MEEIRRDADDELLGFVHRCADGWAALTVFGGRLAVVASEEEAVAVVRTRGLASLAERWYLDEDGAPQEWLLQEAAPGYVRMARSLLGYPDPTSVRTLRAEETGRLYQR